MELNLPSFTIVLLILLALIIGSFLNVLIYRLPRKEEIAMSRSYCPTCKHRLGIIDLIPLFSYLIQLGRCRYCKKEISQRYFWVEFFTVVLFLLVYLRWGFSVETLVGCIFTAILIVAFMTDWEHWIIPDRLTYPAIIIGLLLSFFTVGIWSSLLGLILFGGVLLLAAIISGGGMGGGDIKLAAAIGAFTGWQGAMLAFVIASLSGGIIAFFLLLFKKANRKTPLKFGLFLSFAAFLAYNYAEEIISTYLGLLT